jgi:hypothetical protein
VTRGTVTAAAVVTSSARTRRRCTGSSFSISR